MTRSLGNKIYHKVTFLHKSQSVIVKSLLEKERVIDHIKSWTNESGSKIRSRFTGEKEYRVHIR